MSEDKVPEWVPQVGPQTLADVYPVSPNPEQNPQSSSPAELRLDRHALVHGYSERRLPYEFSSCLPSNERTLPSTTSDASSSPTFTPTDLVKLREGLTILRKSRPTARQRVELAVFSRTQPQNNGHQNKKAFPLQKPTSTSSLEEWFSNLSSNSPATTVSLTRSVPLGPTIGRSTGKVVEMMASRSIPTQRAVWYIRIAVLNEWVKNQRPDRPAPSPSSFWTQQLSNLLRSDVSSLSNRLNSSSGTMDRVSLWRYVLDLVRWQVDEGLVDISQWLHVISDVVRTELGHSQTLDSPGTLIAMLAARRFLPEFLSDTDNASMLFERLLPAAIEVVKAWHSSAPVREIAKNFKGNPRKPMKRAFVPNQCHSEITFLLDAVIRILDSVAFPNPMELRLGDLERFVKRGIEIIKSSRDELEKPGDTLKPNQLSVENHVKLAESHGSIREFEMLPAHGDVARVVSILHAGNVSTSQSNFMIVKTICQWAVEGPTDRAEAITVACSLLSYVASSQKQSESTQSLTSTFLFSKGEQTTSNLKRERIVSAHNQSTRLMSSKISSSSSITAEPSLHRELWQYFKEYSKGREPGTLVDGSYTVRFLAHLCRLNLLSFTSFVRDVSRLSGCGQPGSAYLVKCLSLLPDPKDRSVSDSRRSLLRKYGYASNSYGDDLQAAEDAILRAVFNGNIAETEIRAESLIALGSTMAILSISEAICLERAFRNSDAPGVAERRILSIISFLVHVDEPGMAVEWLLDQLSAVLEESADYNADVRSVKRQEVLTTLILLVGDLSRYIAGSGHLETIFIYLEKIFLCTWVGPAVREQILRTLSSLAAIFSARADGGSLYWMNMVIRVLKQSAEKSNGQSLIPLAAASLRGRLIFHTGSMTLQTLLDTKNPDNLGISPDADLQILSNLSRFQWLDISVSSLRTLFSNTTRKFPMDKLLMKGMTINDIIGAVFIPVLSEHLTDPNAGTNPESEFSRLASQVLDMFRERQYRVRLEGARPTLVIDFMALITAGCAYVHMHPSDSLDVIVQMTWIWRILVPRGGIGLARRLCSRVDYYCEKVATNGKVEWIGFLLNMVLKVYGESGRDEIAVCSALGTEPFGMVEMQLALLAINRHDCDEDEQFGSRVSDSACLDKDGAKTLTSIALECCSFSDDYRQAMAKIIALHAVHKMGESLKYVVSALTMETSRSTAIYLERARQWYDADRARRIVLELCIDSISEEVGSQVEAVLYDQLSSVAKKLSSAMASGSLPSDLLAGGQQISNALESRLTSILRSKRTVQSLERWKQRCLEIAQLLKGGVVLLKKSAIHSCLKVLEMCILRVGDTLKTVDDNVNNSSNGCAGGPTKTKLTCKQIVNHALNRDLRSDLLVLLKPAMFWIEGRPRETLATLLGIGIHGTSSADNVICAVDDDGVGVDNWILLEGYGRGNDEAPAIVPSAFSRQGEGRFRSSNERGKTVKLKRTYSTYSSLAIQ